MPSLVPADLLRFVDLFNAGAYWESHELLEGPWRKSRSEFYHGLILYASAFVHARRGNAVGVAAQLAKAERSLTSYRPHYLGLDVDAILAVAARARTRAALGDAGASPPPLELSPPLLRGSEPELR